jgi:hypothetical protein
MFSLVDQRLRNTLAVVTAIYAVALVPIVRAALGMPPVWGSEVSDRVSLVGFFLSSLPIVLMIATGAAWIAYSRKRPRHLAAAIAIPLLWAAVTLTLMGA